MRLQVQCPTHGERAVFASFADYAETLKLAIHESTRLFGLTRIEKELRLWCQRNNHCCYVPRWLLKEWRILPETG